jgi:hypothetical protein
MAFDRDEYLAPGWVMGPGKTGMATGPGKTGMATGPGKTGTVTSINGG